MPPSAQLECCSRAAGEAGRSAATLIWAQIVHRLRVIIGALETQIRIRVREVVWAKPTPAKLTPNAPRHLFSRPRTSRCT